MENLILVLVFFVAILLIIFLPFVIIEMITKYLTKKLSNWKYEIRPISLTLALLFIIIFIGGGIYFMINDSNGFLKIVLHKPLGSIALFIAYIIIILSVVKKNYTLEHKELVEKAFVEDNMEALSELTNKYYEGKNKVKKKLRKYNIQ